MKLKLKKNIFLIAIFLGSLIIIGLLLTHKKSNENIEEDFPSNEITYSLPTPIDIKPSLRNFIQSNCNAWYNQFLLKSGFNGGMIVAKDGNIVFEKYNGIANLNSRNPLDENTPLHIASVSKTFTAMCVLKLAQEKKIDLDNPFSFYFPSFNYSGITVRSLLSQRSGLPNYVYFMDELGWDKNKFVTNQDVLNYLIEKKSELKNIEQPNRRFTYCNTNYVLLALLIEKITKTPYPQYLHKTIFEPLHMNHTFVYSDADSSKTNPSYDWRWYQAVFINTDKVYGDKNIFSTPRDLLKWDQLLRTNLYLNEASLQKAYTPYSNEHPGIRNYGLGWRMYVLPNGKKIIYHNGWWHGSNAVFIRLLEEKATIILIGNKYDRNIYKARDLIGLFMGNYTNQEEDE